MARDRIIAAAVVAAIVVAGVVTLVLLADARANGVEALEESQASEVLATARSFNQRQINQLSGAAGILGDFEFDFTLDGDDQDKLDEILDLLGGELTTGFFLVDLDGTITAAANMPLTLVGEEYERPGYAAMVANEGFQGGFLPIGEGLSTDVPTTATVFPVPSTTPDGPGPVAGYIVFEAPVTPDDDINREIAQLASSATETWRFVDSSGTVIASSRPGETAEPLELPELLDEPDGFHRVGDQVAVVASVPVSGWTVLFTQDADAFEEALAGPLQDVGVTVVGVLLALAVLISAMLVRQLRNSRAEQRRLRELSEAQEEFVSIVSHELRTPVAGVLGFLQTGLDHWGDLSDDERQHTVSRAMVSARRLQALTRDVLDAQSFETGRLSYDLAEVDLREEVETAVEAAQAMYEHRVFETDLPTTGVHLLADADRLQQVLTNLIDNAHNNSPPDQPIEVSLTVDDHHARVSVRDYGPGLDQDSAERVFEKFVRGRGSNVAGTGLGLYVSRRIVEAHGGRIWADVVQEEGACFTFEVPTSPAPPATTEAESELLG